LRKGAYRRFLEKVGEKTREKTIAKKGLRGGIVDLDKTHT